MEDIEKKLTEKVKALEADLQHEKSEHRRFRGYLDSVIAMAPEALRLHVRSHVTGHYGVLENGLYNYLIFRIGHDELRKPRLPPAELIGS